MTQACTDGGAIHTLGHIRCLCQATSPSSRLGVTVTSPGGTRATPTATPAEERAPSRQPRAERVRGGGGITREGSLAAGLPGLGRRPCRHPRTPRRDRSDARADPCRLHLHLRVVHSVSEPLQLRYRAQLRSRAGSTPCLHWRWPGSRCAEGPCGVTSGWRRNSGVAFGWCLPRPRQDLLRWRLGKYLHDGVATTYSVTEDPQQRPS